MALPFCAEKDHKNENWPKIRIFQLKILKKPNFLLKNVLKVISFSWQ
jgi:hypothetical protein